MILQNPIYIFADNNGSGNSTDVVWKPSANNPNYKASAATFATYGYKATITTPGDNFAMCDPLGDTYTVGDLEQQMTDMSEALLDTYFEPGGRGINVWKVDVGIGKYLLRKRKINHEEKKFSGNIIGSYNSCTNSNTVVGEG